MTVIANRDIGIYFNGFSGGLLTPLLAQCS
jgi:hypothetical protein